MRERFVNEFMTKLEGRISDDDLRIVYQQLIIFVGEYEISPRNTEVVLYEGYLPECYKIFFVTRKIEGMSMKSLELYDMVLRDFFYQVNKKLEEISTNDIRLYLYQTQQTRKICNSTLDGRRTVIHVFMEWAANEGYIVEMFYSTGCRVTELERLDITDVDFQKKEVYLFGKGNKHRTSYLNAKAELAIRNYLASRNDNNQPLFVSDWEPHNRIKKAAIEKRVRKLGETSGIGRRVYPHLIRHTTATDGLDRGMPVEEVQQILGHVNIATTMIYAEVSKANVKNDHRRCIV